MTEEVHKGPNVDAYLNQIVICSGLGGDVAECGVYKGHNTHYYGNMLSEVAPNKIIYGFDSFQGLPTQPEPVPGHDFSDVRYVDVLRFLLPIKNVVLVPGLFEDTLPCFRGHSFSCVILDCDLPDSYLTALNCLYSTVVVGGVIVLDEYFSVKYKGVRFVVDQFFSDKAEEPELFHIEENGWERWRVVKK